MSKYPDLLRNAPSWSDTRPDARMLDERPPAAASSGRDSIAPTVVRRILITTRRYLAALEREGKPK